MADDSPTFTFDVVACQRCGLDHPGMIFRRLSNPVDQFHWWSMCPLNNQPLLASVRGSDDYLTEVKDSPDGQA